MLKKTITYKDYNGVERTEDFMFNLTKAEILEMQLTKDGGMDAAIKKIVDAKDAPEIMKVFKDLILKAYGIDYHYVESFAAGLVYRCLGHLYRVAFAFL